MPNRDSRAGRFASQLPFPSFYSPILEQLEQRLLLSADPLNVTIDDSGDMVYFDPVPDSSISVDEWALAGGENALAEAPPYPVDQTFLLHSNPSALHVIFLDFDGHTTSGTKWNVSFNNGNDFTTPAFSFESGSAFSNAEKERIQKIWERVSEDFIPFDVDVTTEDPGVEALRKTSSADQWGIRVVIGGYSSDWYAGGAGGVAYVGSFDWSSDTPAYVFSEGLSNIEQFIAEASSHEVGHTLGLHHDGTSSVEYYSGHGSGSTGWAPIMGVGYYKELVQWSKGEYPDANNTQDDLAIITGGNGFGYRTDDHGSTRGAASSLGTNGDNVVFDEGIIERNVDQDYFVFATGDGTVDLTVDPFYRSPDLDILATLYDTSGGVISTSNPTNSLNANFNLSLSAGTYYLAVEGVGKDPLSTGYSDYGSLGYYSISGTLTTINHSPVLSNPSVSPTLGTEATIFTYSVDYFDDDGDVPSIADLYIDDIRHTASLDTGMPAEGTYSYSTTLGMGTHNFYFSFEDGQGGFDMTPLYGAPTVILEGTAMVGVDFDLFGGAKPTNWTQWTGGTTATLTNLIDEIGEARPFDLIITGSFTGFASIPDPDTLPVHTQSLAGLDGYVVGPPAWTFTWSDLAPGSIYEVYTFGLRAYSGVNDITITGGGTPISFTQALVPNMLQINDEQGNNSLDLSDFAEQVTADPTGRIVITVTGISTLAMGGLAIRARPQVVGDATGNGYVDDEDLSILLTNWHLNTGWAYGDFSGDGYVDDDDLSLLLTNWHAGTPPAVAQTLDSRELVTRPLAQASEVFEAETWIMEMGIVESTVSSKLSPIGFDGSPRGELEFKLVGETSRIGQRPAIRKWAKMLKAKRGHFSDELVDLMQLPLGEFPLSARL